MQAYAGEKVDGVPSVVQWRVTMRGKEMPLTVTKMNVTSGGLAYYQVVEALSPYPIAFSLKGEKNLLDRIAASTAAQPLLIIGVLTRGAGARIFQVSGVEDLEPSSAATPAAPAPRD
jgi:hypothetical protein